ncbi:MAG: hypothetical protein R3B36_04720 [Polyangiaceae bacterium]
MIAPRSFATAAVVASALLYCACDKSTPPEAPAPTPPAAADAGAPEPAAARGDDAGASGASTKGDASAYYPGSRDKPQ